MMPDVFWDLTFAEFYLMAKGHYKRQAEAHNRVIMGAWYVAALSRQQKLPDLETLLIPDEPKQVQEQTPAQMIDYLKILTVAMGGEVVIL